MINLKKMDNKSQKIDWITPELVSHGDMSDITRGIPELGNAKEVGGDDGGTWLGQSVSS